MDLSTLPELKASIFACSAVSCRSGAVAKRIEALEDKRKNAGTAAPSTSLQGRALGCPASAPSAAPGDDTCRFGQIVKGDPAGARIFSA